MEFFYGNWRALLRKTVRFDTAQNEFFSDKKGTGGEKSRIFLTQMFVSIHLYTNTIPYKPSNCNVSFFTKKNGRKPGKCPLCGRRRPRTGERREGKRKISQFFPWKTSTLQGRGTEGEKIFSWKISTYRRRKPQKKAEILQTELLWINNTICKW